MNVIASGLVRVGRRGDLGAQPMGQSIKIAVRIDESSGGAKGRRIDQF